MLRHAAVIFFCILVVRLHHNCVSFPWRLETVRRTLVTKSGDVATTNDQWQLALSPSSHNPV